jgi:spore coat polysaccharide biosynthesis protein SpsF
MLPFYEGKTISEILIDRLISYFPNNQIIIATTDGKVDDNLVKLLKSYPVHIFRGDENNVLKRLIEGGKKYQVDRFVRVCADNPFLDMQLMEDMMNQFTEELDYLSYHINGIPSMKTTFGFFAEITRINVLERVLNLTRDPIHLEHVTNFIYENPELFRVGFLSADSLIANNNHIRFTVDTKNDFDLAQGIFAEISKIKPKFYFGDLISLAIKNNLLEQMKTETSENKK